MESTKEPFELQTWADVIADAVGQKLGPLLSPWAHWYPLRKVRAEIARFLILVASLLTTGNDQRWPED
jgi:hypothetical protein